MKIEPIALLSDNYAWLLSDESTGDCAVVDPSEGPPVAKLIEKRGLRLRCVLATHHHPDHTGGIKDLAAPGIDVFASRYDHTRERTPRVTQPLDDGVTFRVLGEEVRCLAVPGHTLGAVAFYLPRSAAVFTGDTLFTGGCGRLFEGEPAQMHASLQKLAALPPETRVYCGHEYTEKNLRFAQACEPDSKPVLQRLQDVQALRSRQAPTVPATLQVERATNPFMRVGAESLQQATGERDPVRVLAVLRERRDNF